MDNNEMWDRLIEPKRAYRRRMRERKIKRFFNQLKQEDWRFSVSACRVYNTWTCIEYDDTIKKIWNYAVKMINAPAFCNKYCCANPRRYLKGSYFYEKTMQEKVNKDNYNQQLKELDDE